MPIYEYRCSSCGNEHEVLQKISEPRLTTCPTCGKDALTKLISAAGFQLKGSGWYATDFKGGTAKPGKEKENAEGKAADSEKKPDSGKAPGGETTKEERKESKESKPDKAADSTPASTAQ